MTIKNLNRTKLPLRALLTWLYGHSKGCHLQAVTNGLIGMALVGLGLWSVDTFRLLTDIATGDEEGNLIAVAVVLIAIFLGELALRCVQAWVTSVLGVRTQNTMQRYFFSRLLHGQWNGIDKYHSGDILNRMFGDVEDIVKLMTEVVPMFVTVFVQFVASFIYLYLMDQTLALVVIVATPVFLLLSRVYFHKMRRIVRHVKDSNSSLQAIIQESVQHKMVIKVLQRENLMIDKLERRQDLLFQQTKSRARLTIYTKIFITIGFTGAYLVGFIMGLVELQDGIITVGVLMAFTQLIHRIQRPMLDMARLVPIFVNSMTSTERLMELEALPLENMGEETSSCDEAVGVSINNIDFKYTDKGRKVLNAFSHVFAPGSFTAILGETGSGKTTLIRMILALITPQRGSVEMTTASGKRIAATPSVRSLISYITQGNTLFSGSIRENLLMGNPDATTEEMMQALHVAMADFVKDLPDGLFTKCGEQGGGLSEGQAQRIAIARAILRPCRLLLLDEATSALDVQTEKKLLENLKQHFKDTTIIFVTHRLAVVDFTSDVITMERNVSD